MGKVAKLVRVTLVTRVIVDEDATLQNIMELAVPKLSESMMDSPFEMIEEIVDDLECPYVEGEDEGEVPFPAMSDHEHSMLVNAGELLCPNDTEDLIQMVRAIVNHKDEFDLIDFIDGVTVYQRVECSLTVRQFLKEVGYTGVEFKD